MSVLGIDPGKVGGALCVLEQGRPHEPRLFDMPASLVELVDLIGFVQGMGPLQSAAVEEQGAFARSGGKIGAKSVFTIGRGYGWLEAALVAHQVPFVAVRPQEWQKGLGLPHGARGPRKKAAVELARRLAPMFAPSTNWERTTGRADAYLIARWAYGRVYGA